MGSSVFYEYVNFDTAEASSSGLKYVKRFLELCSAQHTQLYIVALRDTVMRDEA